MTVPNLDENGCIFQAQHISVSYFESTLLLKETLALLQNDHDGIVLVVIDITLYPGDCYSFCRWCRDNHPGVKVLLMDSNRTQISDLERKVAVKNGALNLLPALEKSSLVLDGSTLLAQANEVMHALHKSHLTESGLLEVLRNSNVISV